MAQGIPLSSLFRVKGRFRRSVNVVEDSRDGSALSSYIVTPLARSALGQIALGLRPGSLHRSWSITGPYGTGKSACALFISRVLAYPLDRAARELLKGSDPGLYQEVMRGIPELAEGGFFIVPVVGSRTPLPLTIVDGLTKALSGLEGADPHLSDILRDLAILEDSIRRGLPVSPSELVGLIERTAAGLPQVDSRILGLLIIIDELGKLLEYAALDPKHADIFLLQQLSEVADRSTKAPIGLMVVLHQDFARYADRLGAIQQQEWRKVHARFKDIAFLASQDEMLGLLQAALEQSGSLDGLADICMAEAQRARELEIGPLELDRRTLVERLAGCAPLHPVVALLLVRLFRRHLAQNERSLFAFLSSGEPHALQEFLQEAYWDGRSRPFYRIDRLYDYVADSMGSALYSLPLGKRWAEIDESLERLPADSPSIDARVIKAIGLLGLLGDQRHLKPSLPVLVYALEDGSVTAEDVRSAVRRLERSRIVVYRHYKCAYALWEGSDIDLEERFQTALARLDRSEDLASQLTAHAPLNPYIAKRHLHETGTLRYFAPLVTHVDRLEELRSRPAGSSDGIIAFVLGEPDTPPEAVLARVEETARLLSSPERELIFFAVPKDLSGIAEALEEMRALEWVQENTPELQGDAAARKELLARKLDAQGRLSRLCARVFDRSSSNSACLWFWNGKVRQFKTPADLSSALSEACDLAFHGAPILQNELVNRASLSSSAAAARRNLIERMLANPSQYRFGMETGFPPEVSIYLSILERSRLHHRDGQRWVLGPDPSGDPCRVAAVWNAIDGFLSSTEGGKKPVSELFALLRRPPYGLRDGVLPILLATALLHWENDVALFELGTFIPRPDIVVFERLMKRPDQFQLQRYRLDGTRLRMLRQYSALLQEGRAPSEPPTLLSAIRPILGIARKLNGYARATSRVSSQAAAVREALFSAREPHRLLFESLPRSLGMDPDRVASDERAADRFFEELRGALAELAVAYDRLLEEIRGRLFASLRLPAELDLARVEIQQRAAALQPFAPDLKVRAFLHRIADPTLPAERWLESVAAGLAGKVPAQWGDQDLARFELALAEMSTQMRRIEEVALELGRGPQIDGEGRLFRLSIMHSSGEERKGLVRLLPGEEEAARAVADEIEEQLRGRGLPESLVLAALAELARRALSASTTEHEEHTAQDVTKG